MTEPETKRRRVELQVNNKNLDVDSNVIEDDKSIIERLLMEMKISKSNIDPILDDDLICELPTKEIYVGTVLEKKFINISIITLNNAFPLTGLQHLKRARNIEILLVPCHGISIAELKDALLQKGFAFDDHFESDIKIISVVSKPPLTKKQYEIASKLWPCNFHPEKNVERLVSGAYFNEKEIAKHRKYMSLAYEVAEVYEGIKEDNGKIEGDAMECTDVFSEDLIVNTDNESDIDLKDDLRNKVFNRVKRHLRLLRGTVIVDPKIDSIVAVGYDRRTLNPCQHPVMIAIDNVARSQYGGAWNDDSMFAEEIPNENNDLVVDGVPKMFRNILNASYDNLKFGARPTRRRNLGVIKADVDILDGISEKRILKKETSETDDTDGSLASPCIEDVDNKPSGPYLCTGYDVYTTNEPCVMCAMALVHSRAKRVFYGLKDETNGALGSISSLHSVTALNHHYEVFSNFFESS